MSKKKSMFRSLVTEVAFEHLSRGDAAKTDIVAEILNRHQDAVAERAWPLIRQALMKEVGEVLKEQEEIEQQVIAGCELPVALSYKDDKGSMRWIYRDFADEDKFVRSSNLLKGQRSALDRKIGHRDRFHRAARAVWKFQPHLTLAEVIEKLSSMESA